MNLGTCIHVPNSTLTGLKQLKRRATRWNLNSNDKYGSRLSELNLQTLSDMRYSRDVVFLYNVINKYYNIVIDHSVTTET